VRICLKKFASKSEPGNNDFFSQFDFPFIWPQSNVFVDPAFSLGEFLFLSQDLFTHEFQHKSGERELILNRIP
jgi:hypothetical protein